MLLAGGFLLAGFSRLLILKAMAMSADTCHRDTLRSRGTHDETADNDLNCGCPGHKASSLTILPLFPGPFMVVRSILLLYLSINQDLSPLCSSHSLEPCAIVAYQHTRGACQLLLYRSKKPIFQSPLLKPHRRRY
ncbi:hypothetical protein HGRIS_005315 [Hohenbuehelia grisea]|uniref:Secreted protein n=1 Tax=Hohenbuehelia grisea TaxID=104357 RepID=A0ABR3JF64_9AGAR